MNNKHKKKIASWIILLIILMPVYSSLVYADLASVGARGSDNVLNTIRGEDFITFTATASIFGDNITPNQVFLGSNLKFDSCAVGINGFDCKLRFPSQGTDQFYASIIPYTIVLKNDAGNIVDTKSDEVVVDILPPKLNSFTTEESLIGSDTVTFSYNVKEEACAVANCDGKCSGIKSIELFELEGNFRQTIDINTDSCTVSDSFDMPSTSFLEGKHTIFAQAFDNFNQVSASKSVLVEIDNSAPFIDLNTFKVVDESDLDFGFFGPNPVPVTVKVDIKDPNLNANNVFADLSELNPQENLNNVKADCVTTDNTNTCSWQINLKPGSAGAKNVKISASDILGNDANIQTTKNFEFDDTAPVLLSLASSRVFDGKNYAKLDDNSFTATLRESGAGLKASDIKLHIGSAIQAADTCAKVVDTWQCTWNDVDFESAGVVDVFIGADSKDRLGNSVLSSFSKQVIVDNTKPKLLILNITNIGGIEAAFEGVIKTGDKLHVRAAIEDESLDTAVADFSKFIFNADSVSADDCVKTGDKTFVCSWTTSSINIQGFINDFIEFEFIDVAGNALEVIESLIVYGVSGQQTPDFFDNEVRCSPSLLDRETMPLINQRAFCQVKLIPKSLVNTIGTFQDITPVSISLSECQGDTGFIESFELFNNQLGSTEPFIKVNFRKQSATADEINFVCTLDIISRQGDTIVTTPETENAELNFQFYNLPLGEVSSSVQKKIDDAIDDAGGIWDLIGFLQKVVFFAERACQFKGIFDNLVATWELFTVAVGEVEKIPVANFLVYGPRVAACEGVEAAHVTRVEAIWPEFNKFCNAVNCKAGRALEGQTGWEKWQNRLGGGWGIAQLDNWLGAGRVEPNEDGSLVNPDGTINIINPDVKVIEPGLGGDVFGLQIGSGAAWTGRNPFGPGGYMNVKDSIVLSVLTVCVPGIIHNLDKYRQIQCMYADCLQTAVGEQGLPVFVCEDQKEYATCKYVVGEIFKILPITALFNYYMNLIRDTLANPFEVLGVALAAYCNTLCPIPREEPHFACIWPKILGLLGESIKDVTSIFDQGFFSIKDDFCDRLEENDESDDEDSGGLV